MQIKVAKDVLPPTPYFLEQLQKHFGKKVHLSVQKNRTNLLHIKRFFNTYQISMHHLFYELTEGLFEQLFLFAKKGKRAKEASKQINAFIESKSHLIIRQNKPGIMQGRVYDLEEIFAKVNANYFHGEFDLFLTWTPQRKSRGNITLGSFEKGDPKGLIKVNGILDHQDVPKYFVEFVVYHEALHHLFPIVMNGTRRVIHSRAFRQKEKLFKEYPLAKKWEKQQFSKAILR